MNELALLEPDKTEGATCCINCADTGYIVWFMVNHNGQLMRYVVLPYDPKSNTFQAKDCTFEKCDCIKGQKWN